jgi:hypothetical protein
MEVYPKSLPVDLEPQDNAKLPRSCDGLWQPKTCTSSGTEGQPANDHGAATADVDHLAHLCCSTCSSTQQDHLVRHVALSNWPLLLILPVCPPEYRLFILIGVGEG